tara:strand:+ start:737 stop:2419 length:1683 start_codon:yes stop_codon:yes gene_type:complete
MILTPENRIKIFTENGWWGDDTLYSIFQKACNESPNNEALLDPPNRNQITGDDPKRLNFSEINYIVEKYSSVFFKAGLRKDDIVIIQLPNIVELPILYLALTQLGIIISPIPMQYRNYEIKKIVNDIKPKGYVGISNFNDEPFSSKFKESFNKKLTLFSIGKIDNFITLDKKNSDENIDEEKEVYLNKINITANDILTICWTSGTTGMPKGVPRSHNLWLAISKAAYHIADTKMGDILLNPFPLVNMASIGGFLFNWLICQGKLVQHHPFDMQIFLDQMSTEKINYTIAAPAIMNMLLNNKELFENLDLSNLRSIGCGGAPLSEWMVETFQNKYNITIQNVFGSNEGMSLLSSRADVEDPKLRAVYFPRFGVKDYDWKNPVAKTIKTKLVNLETNKEIHDSGVPGELLISGATVFDGYWNSPDVNKEVFDQDGYFRTGDMFEISSAETDYKFYKYCGRCKDLIIRGGMNISPEELDYLLISHPSLADVSVTGYDDEILGERVGVVAVLNEGCGVTLEEIIDFLKDLGIAKYKLPENLKIIDELPRNPVGKVLRNELKRLF